ncbi:MAG: hypothetical protein PHX87_00205 [Candidatus Peribacteraceae bacterium]|nr:hypothetical protein [Candidatus Peribacteraceae bacterium]MDD5741830.1 hypothetical protein [Candidatus Peribacteraceae bacterium]
MDKRTTTFLAAARSCALSPMEHAEARAALVAHMAAFREAPAILQESVGSLRLTDDEKSIGRARLLHFVRTHPLEEHHSSFLGKFFRRFTSASIASAITIALAGGGIVFAAESSLPGDVLYAVKVNITEPIRSGLSGTPVARAQWNVRQIERRLEEAAALKERPDQNERQVILRSQMEQDIGGLQEHLSALPSEEQRMIRSDFLLALTQHQQSIRQIQATAGIPPGLKALAENAADEQEKPTEANRENAQSSSQKQEQSNQQKQGRNTEERKEKQIVMPATAEERRQRITSESASTGDFSSETPIEPEHASSSEQTRDNEKNRRQDPEHPVQSLLRLLGEGSFSPSESSAAGQTGSDFPAKKAHVSSIPSHEQIVNPPIKKGTEKIDL